MTAGIQSAQGLAAAGQNVLYSVVTGGGGTTFGFQAAAHGSITPGTYRGGTISHFQAIGVRDLQFTIQAEVAQNIWTYLVVELEVANTFRLYASANATFSPVPGSSTWLFGDGSSKVWTSTGITRRVFIFI